MEARISCDILFEKLSPESEHVQYSLRMDYKYGCVWAGGVMCGGESVSRERESC